MDKQGWNWKTHLLAASIGFFIGRYSKNIERHQNVSSDEGFDVDKEIEAVLLISGVLKEALKEIGEPIPKEEVDSLDTDKIFGEVLEEVFQKGWVDKHSFSNKDEKSFRGFMSFMMNQFKKTLLSSIPTVPSYVSKDVFDATERRIRSTMARRKESGRFYEFGDSLPKLESVVDKWMRESRPETYTRTLALIINEAKLHQN
jgi:hypothetical protein